MHDFRHRRVSDTATIAPGARTRTVEFRTPTDEREARAAKTQQAPFVPPATRDAAIERRELLVKRVAELQLWLQNNGKRHFLRVEKVAERDHAAEELRLVKAWLHEQHVAAREERDATRQPAKTLVRSLAEIINRLIDDGAKLSDTEHETLDRAAGYAGE